MLAVVIAAAMVAGNSTNAPTAEANGACGSRIEASIPSILSDKIARACYDESGGKNQGVQLFLTNWGAFLAALPWGEWQNTFAAFVVYNSNWEGNRPLDSVGREIKWHARSGMWYPIHIEYRCEDLKTRKNYPDDPTKWYEDLWSC